MTVTPLKTAARREDDPLRSELAAAIERARDAQDRVDRQRSAIERTRSSRLRATAAVQAAEEGVGKAQQIYASALADAAASDTEPPASGVGAARQAVVTAQDALAAHDGALARLKADLPGLQELAHDAEVEVQAAVSAILAAPASQLLERARALEAELDPIRGALCKLLRDRTSGGAVDISGHERSLAPLSEVYAGIMKFGAWRDGDGPDRWKEARERLREDAFAALPDFAPPPPT